MMKDLRSIHHLVTRRIDLHAMQHISDDARRFRIRQFAERDAVQLLNLMKKLAVIEGYIDDFRVTEHELIERALGDNPQFVAMVAYLPDSERLVGMAVAYLVPFSYNLRPVAVLKELFVEEEWRGTTIGRSLFYSTLRWAENAGCATLRWDVLQHNYAAMQFYDKLGGAPFSPWQAWAIKLGQ